MQKTKRTLLLIASSVAGAVALAISIGRAKLAKQFAREVASLFGLSGDVSHHIYRPAQIDTLPQPVQRYFTYTLKDGQPYISYVRIKHNGQFKTNLDKDWINITGEQYATTEKPGFIWKGTTALFVARDMYIADAGRLVATLLYVYNVADAQGEKYNEGELLRWLGESVLYPTNLLPGSRVKWLPVDDNSSRLTFRYNGLDLFFNFTFNELGQITEMETKRYMGDESREAWVIKLSDYREMNDIMIPTSLNVLWRLEQGDFSYAKFNVTTVEYNNPHQF